MTSPPEARPPSNWFTALGRLTGWRGDLARTLIGALAASALPPVHAIPVLLVCVPCLLVSLDSAAGWRGGFRRGWWFGFGLNLIGLYWITEAILIESARFWWLVPLAVPALAAVMGVFTGAAAAVARLASPGWPRALVLAGAWTLADMARQFVATGFPWNPLGSVWGIPGAAGDLLIQPAAWISVHGLTLLTVLLAAAPALSWRWRIAGVAVFANWIVIGALRLAGGTEALIPVTMVIAVQGNVAQGQKWNPILAAQIFDRYLSLTSAALAQAGAGPRVVVWPETAVPYLLETDQEARRQIEAVMGSAIGLIGGVRFGPDARPRNSLFALGGRVVTRQIYDKSHLVPFGEYQPDWLPLGVQLVPGGGFAAGPGPTTLTPLGIPPVGPLICYEAIFPGQVVARTDRPAWLVNITNDAWFGNSSGPRQHLAAARMRAVEEGLPLIRAANTGISAVFDAHGHEVGRIGMGQTNFLIAPLMTALPPTFFARLGLVVPSVLSGVMLAVGGLCSLGRRRRGPGY